MIDSEGSGTLAAEEAVGWQRLRPRGQPFE
jgi:hypothetical protein